jgi:hypothetical protein
MGATRCHLLSVSGVPEYGRDTDVMCSSFAGAEYRQELETVAGLLRSGVDVTEVVRRMNDLGSGVDLAMVRLARILASTVLR